MKTSPPILCLGPIGTYAHEAAQARFGHDVSLAFCDSNYAVLRRLAAGAGRGAVGVVPIENSKEGIVGDTRDFWLDTLDALQPIVEPALRVVGEIHLPITHCLAVLGGSSGIRVVRSHPQALGQCSRFLRELGVVGTAAKSTAEAADFVARQSEEIWHAAICSPFTASLYGLTVAEREIADRPDNVTRFHVVTADGEPSAPTGADRTAIVLEVPDSAGKLAGALRSFSDHDVNVSDLQTVGLGPGRYAHYLEVDCHQDDELGRKAFLCLSTHIKPGRMLVLGSYPRSPLLPKGGNV